MTLLGAKALPELNNRDLRVLVAIERGMIKQEFVPIENIASFVKLTISKTEFILKKCHKLDLVHRWSGHYVGYELTIHGYDALALNALYEKGLITSLGREKGVGKEAKVFYALTKDEQEVVIKLHRIGFTSFQQVKKKRRYTANKKHISEIYASRLSAESETNWLKLANKFSLSVPKYIDSNRHAIVQELIIGDDLNKIRQLEDPSGILEQVLDFIKIAWQEGEFVHGDLSEFNIIITLEDDNEKAIMIDFPQSVESYAPNGDELLRNDIKNVLTYFNRKYGIYIDEMIIYDHIVNKVPIPE